MITAEYINHLGSDNTVADSARVSFDKRAELYSAEANAKLIKYLAAHAHTTPFTHPQITLRETVPIFIARQRFKHVVGFTYNETSRRYVDSTPEFYTPDVWRKRPSDNAKQGSGGKHPSTLVWQEIYKAQVSFALETYKRMINEGVAPEQARMILPQSMMTSYYVTGSLAAFARMFNQRTDPHAQKEIQDLAIQIGEIIQPLYPVSWEALTKKTY